MSRPGMAGPHLSAMAVGSAEFTVSFLTAAAAASSFQSHSWTCHAAQTAAGCRTMEPWRLSCLGRLAPLGVARATPRMMQLTRRLGYNACAAALVPWEQGHCRGRDCQKTFRLQQTEPYLQHEPKGGAQREGNLPQDEAWEEIAYKCAHGNLQHRRSSATHHLCFCRQHWQGHAGMRLGH